MNFYTDGFQNTTSFAPTLLNLAYLWLSCFCKQTKPVIWLKYEWSDALEFGYWYRELSCVAIMQSIYIVQYNLDDFTTRPISLLPLNLLKQRLTRNNSESPAQNLVYNQTIWENISSKASNKKWSIRASQNTYDVIY